MNKDFDCEKCGLCCKTLADSQLEALGLPRAEGGGCGHLLADNTCAIYKDRPDLCNVAAAHGKFFAAVPWAEFRDLNRAACRELQDRAGWKVGD